jgi:hypothetical protein
VNYLLETNGPALMGAREEVCWIIMVAVRAMRTLFSRWLHPITPERRHQVFRELCEAARPSFSFYAMIVLSCAIATFGLVTNSVAVIIGAMLVAPLMSPILGLALAAVLGKSHRGCWSPV